MFTPFLMGLGPQEMIIILVILVLLFGATKLPELARGSGRALRIFKAETKGLLDDDDDLKSPEEREIEARRAETERLTREARERNGDTTT
jgi:sec-independent protein translocase protein TatA